MPATVQVEHLQGSGPTVVPLVQMRFRNDDTSGMDAGAPITLPPDVEATTPAISGSAAAQDVTITPATDIGFGSNDYAIVEPGTSRQEVVLISGVPGAGQITAIFRRNHPAGSLMQKVIAAFGKNLRVNLVTKPDHTFSNLRFCRTVKLPAGIFDQYRLKDSYTPSDAFPWASDSGTVYSSVPQDPTLIYGGPLLTSGPVPKLVEVQWLYTARTVPSSILDEAQIQQFLMLTPSSYRFSWDES